MKALASLEGGRAAQDRVDPPPAFPGHGQFRGLGHRAVRRHHRV